MCEPAAILAELQIFVTLEDGDVVMTGTPKGVDVIAAGDEFIGKVLLREQIFVSQTWLTVWFTRVRIFTRFHC